METSERLLRRGLWLEHATLGWNVAGTFLVLSAARRAGSVALAGFGLDSLIEIGASTVVIWELKNTGQGREILALRLIGAAFFALALYVGMSTFYSLWMRAHPATSPLGIFWLALTFVVMLLLAKGKAFTGTQLGSRVLQTEARVTVVDAFLAGSVLLGIGLNALLGWWWADPLASLVIVFYGIKEGRHAFAEAKNFTPTV